MEKERSAQQASMLQLELEPTLRARAAAEKQVQTLLTAAAARDAELRDAQHELASLRQQTRSAGSDREELLALRAEQPAWRERAEEAEASLKSLQDDAETVAALREELRSSLAARADLHAELLAKTREVETERVAKHVALAERATLEGRLAEGQERNAALEARAHDSPSVRLEHVFDSPPPERASLIPPPRASLSPRESTVDAIDAAWSSAMQGTTTTLKKLRPGLYMFGSRRVECVLDGEGGVTAKCAMGEMPLEAFVAKFAGLKTSTNVPKVTAKLPARVRLPLKGKENEADVADVVKKIARTTEVTPSNEIRARAI